MTAFTSADILLPKLDAEGMTKWSVVACDQYTSEPEYWAKTADSRGRSLHAEPHIPRGLPRGAGRGRPHCKDQPHHAGVPRQGTVQRV